MDFLVRASHLGGPFSAPAATRQELLANGISVAMFTTATGLLIALPTLLLHAAPASRTSRIIDEHAIKLVNLLVAQRSERSATADRVSPP